MKYVFLWLSGLAGGLLLSAPVMADDAFGANQTGGSLVSQITMTVGTPTCSLDRGSQTVDFSDITVAQLRAGSATPMDVGVKLSCDSVPAGITLTMKPTGGSSADNIASPGVVTGSAPGTGYKLTWAAGSAFGSQDSTVDYNVPLTILPARVTELKMMATPVATTSGRIESGTSTATINMVLKFS